MPSLSIVCFDNSSHLDYLLPHVDSSFRSKAHNNLPLQLVLLLVMAKSIRLTESIHNTESNG